MPVPGVLMMFFLQASGLDGRDVHWLMIFAGVIADAMVAQALGLIGSAIFASKMLKKVEHLSDSFDQKTTPVMMKATALLDDLGPKIRSVSENVEQISYTVREKCDELGATLTQINRTVVDVNARTQIHVARVDGLVTDALDTTEEVSRVVQDGIRTPVRQIAGIVAGLKAGLETLVKRSPFGKGKGLGNPFDL